MIAKQYPMYITIIQPNYCGVLVGTVIVQRAPQITARQYRQRLQNEADTDSI